jgi:hypothetical protein
MLLSGLKVLLMLIKLYGNKLEDEVLRYLSQPYIRDRLEEVHRYLSEPCQIKTGGRNPYTSLQAIYHKVGISME